MSQFMTILAIFFLTGCASKPTLEHLEDEANTTGDWTAVERREELKKERLELTAPGCPVGQRKKCFEEQTGIECYCLHLADGRH